jgi:hypothetical protein
MALLLLLFRRGVFSELWLSSGAVEAVDVSTSDGEGDVEDTRDGDGDGDGDGEAEEAEEDPKSLLGTAEEPLEGIQVKTSKQKIMVCA